MERYNNDDELVYLMRCGSQEAETYLYKRYYHLMRKWILPFSHYHYQGYEYEDFLQIAMMNFTLVIDSYRDDQKTSLRTFMKSAVIRRLLTLIQSSRMNTSYQTVSFDENVNLDGRLTYEEIIEDPMQRHRPEIIMVVKETETEYQALLEEKFSLREMEIMKLSQIGYSNQEIADKLDISLKSVYNAVYRYHKKVQAIDESK